MRFPPGTKMYKELHRRLDACEAENSDLDEAALTKKLWEVRDAYVREIRKECGMNIHE
jgi:hypothetical protein